MTIKSTSDLRDQLKQHGLIKKVAVMPATTNAKGLNHVCPNQGSIYADKAYCVSTAKKAAAKRGCHLAAIKKNNLKGQNRDQDRWYSKIRSPGYCQSA